MAVKPNPITDVWTAITSAGESGTCWVQKKPKKGLVIVSHSTTGTGGILAWYPLSEPPPFILGIPADGVGDIYYAKCLEAGEVATINSDVI